MKRIIIIAFFLASISGMAQIKVFDTIKFYRGGQVYKMLLYNDSMLLNNRWYYSFPGFGVTHVKAAYGDHTHSGLGDSFWAFVSGSTSNIYSTNTGNIGVGTTNTNAKFAVSSSGIPAISCYTTDNTSIIGYSTNSPGIQGTSMQNHGGYFSSTYGGYGIYTTSGSGAAIYAQAGTGPAGLFMGGNVGIGVTNPEYKLDVQGNIRAQFTGDGIGISGYASGSSSQGVSGSSPNIGVYGSGNYGIYGTSSGIASIYGTSTTAETNAIRGINSSISASAVSIYGESNNGYAIFGRSYYSGIGVYGISASSTGVYGASVGGNGGTFSSQTANAIYASSTSGYGITAISNSQSGIIASSTLGSGGTFTSYSGKGIHVTSSIGYAAVFEKGNVGVGITNPIEKLEVNGTIKGTIIKGISTSTLTAVYGQGDNIAIGAEGGAYGVYSNTNTTGYAFYAGRGKTWLDSLLYVRYLPWGTGSERMVVWDSITKEVKSRPMPEPAITASTSAKYWRGDKTFQTLDKTAVGLSNVENTALSTWQGTTNISYIGTLNTALSVNDSTLRIIKPGTPGAADAKGNVGQICWDDNYIYVCYEADKWKRVAITQDDW